MKDSLLRSEVKRMQPACRRQGIQNAGIQNKRRHKIIYFCFYTHNSRIPTFLHS